MTADILFPLVTVGLAELGDKTQLTILLLASQTKEHLQLFAGALIAFLIADGFAVLVGSWIADVVPTGLLKIFSGAVFLIFGVLQLIGKEAKSMIKTHSGNVFFSAFTMISLTEWGDKTQIASGLLATKYNALMVLLGTVTALAFLSIAAIWVGKYASNKIDKKVISRIAGIVFVLTGLSFFLF